jgi:Flp pilus assembly protein TadB
VIVVAAGLAAMSAWLFIRPPRKRGARWGGTRAARGIGSTTQMIWVVCALVGVVLAVVIGGLAGILVGILAAIAGPRLLSTLESRSQRARREELERQVPAVADLLAACLAAGATQHDSARAVGRALGEPVATPLARLTGALELGADPVTAWAALGSDAPLGPIARAAARSAETGAPLSVLLSGIADDQRDEARARAEAAARAAGVKSVAPLVACFLPAFILIGIVPVVASLALPLLQ